MLFTYPSFINTSEQDLSRLLYNNVSITLRSQLDSIFFNLKYGTEMRTLLEEGIDGIVMAELQEEIERSLLKYFENDLKLYSLEAHQEDNIVYVELTYIELRTGKFNSVQTEYVIANNDAYIG